MENLREILNPYYQKHIKNTGEIITFEEWHLLLHLQEGEKYREFEGQGKKILQYGLSFLTAGVLGVGLLYLYRHLSDTCRKTCGPENAMCYNKCYLQACEKNISLIKQDLTRIKANKEIPAEKKQQRIHKLNMELDKWQGRAHKYKQRLMLTR